MKFGLSDQQMEILNKLLILPLKNKKAKVYVFGSRTRGKHHPFSDIDILFEESPSDPISEAEILKIKDALEESHLAVKVDIVSSKNLAKSFAEIVHNEKNEI